MRILVLGISGMLGNAVYQYLSKNKNYEVYGTIRKDSAKKYFNKHLQENIISRVDSNNLKSINSTINTIKPNVIINCIGVIKQLPEANDPLVVLPINSLFPHQLAKICTNQNIKLIHISTDCVFSGNFGFYSESEVSDAEDLYGKSKFIGEVHSPNVTLRTSIIGHEINTKNGLLEWFLSSEDRVNGFAHAIFSGVTTLELAKTIESVIDSDISGLYHVSSRGITKLELLRIIKYVYKKDIEIVSCRSDYVDRSLDDSKLRSIISRHAPDWTTMLEELKDFYER